MLLQNTYVLASFLLKHIIQFGTFHNDAENANNVVGPEFHSCGDQMAPHHWRADSKSPTPNLQMAHRVILS